MGAIVLVLSIILLYFTYEAVRAYLEIPGVIEEIYASGRLGLRLEDMPGKRLDALLAVEDPGFYAHNGIDLSTPGAGWTTITQGLVKIYFFDGFSPGFLKINKLKQSVIAMVFDARVEKRTQLRIFINTVYLGTRDGKDIVGFQNGAHAYYNRELTALTDEEFLSLVAMIIAPNDLDPLGHPAENHERVARIGRLLEGECAPASVDDVYYRNCPPPDSLRPGSRTPLR